MLAPQKDSMVMVHSRGSKISNGIHQGAKWRPCEVLAHREQWPGSADDLPCKNPAELIIEVLIHYKNFDKEYDEWIPTNSKDYMTDMTAQFPPQYRDYNDKIRTRNRQRREPKEESDMITLTNIVSGIKSGVTGFLGWTINALSKLGDSPREAHDGPSAIVPPRAQSPQYTTDP